MTSSNTLGGDAALDRNDESRDVKPQSESQEHGVVSGFLLSFTRSGGREPRENVFGGGGDWKVIGRTIITDQSHFFYIRGASHNGARFPIGAGELHWFGGV